VLISRVRIGAAIIAFVVPISVVVTASLRRISSGVPSARIVP
jgi:hypothetical protein